MLLDSALAILDAIVDSMRRHKIIRAVLTILSFIFSVASFSFYIIIFVLDITPLLHLDFQRIAQTIMYVSLFLFFLCIASYANLNLQPSPSSTDIDLIRLREEREQLKERITKDKKADVFDTIQLNLNHITEYYTINKSQARDSF